MAAGVRIGLSEHVNYRIADSLLVEHNCHSANRLYLAVHYHISITLSGRDTSMTQQFAHDRNVAASSEYHCDLNWKNLSHFYTSKFVKFFQFKSLAG